MRETGQISDISHGFAEIRLNTRGGCSSCGAAGMCHVSGTADRKIRLPMNGLDAQTGDFVEIETPARSLLSAAFLIFILPLIISGLAYFIIMQKTESQGWALSGFFSFFVFSEILILIIDKWIGHSRYFEPKIIAKVK